MAGCTPSRARLVLIRVLAQRWEWISAVFTNAGAAGRAAGGYWTNRKSTLIRDTEVLVPDLTGWRRERMPRLPRDHRFEVVPDWVCEILSPSTARTDRVVKMPIYARYGVSCLWLVDPLVRTLEVFALRDGRWTVIGLFQEQDLVTVEPFAEIALELGGLWADLEDQ